MKRKKQENSNVKLAGIFIIFVLGLIILSTLFKFFLIVKSSRFDGSHSFIVNFVGERENNIVAFSPQNKSLSTLIVDNPQRDSVKALEIPVDGEIAAGDFNKDKVSEALLKSVLSLGKSLKHLTILDALRLFIFSETVPANNVNIREITSGLNDAQKATLIALSFNDPDIYQENQSIQIINAADVFGAGGRLAALITNIGGNVILVSTSDQTAKNSKITYFQNESYTVKKLSNYLGIPAEKSDNRGVADVIITVGKDVVGGSKF